MRLYAVLPAQDIDSGSGRPSRAHSEQMIRRLRADLRDIAKSDAERSAVASSELTILDRLGTDGPLVALQRVRDIRLVAAHQELERIIESNRDKLLAAPDEARAALRTSAAKRTCARIAICIIGGDIDRAEHARATRSPKKGGEHRLRQSFRPVEGRGLVGPVSVAEVRDAICSDAVTQLLGGAPSAASKLQGVRDAAAMAVSILGGRTISTVNRALRRVRAEFKFR